ncbi:DUF4405 domain-containing protein [Cereibacter sediminicola]|uniref:DUF4405 domain-containing protein n=1 Tax=Cereibacter sediminicola TaxID=2584941 RepID=UPI0011AB1D63|nr:DUF4405 domain-containing protein [Cereibacter sediminicola]
MSSVLGRYATPFITGLFLVSLISGIALFFHIGPGGFHGMHEWLSMVLILPFALHLWKNWRGFLNQFRRRPMGIALAASALAGALFLLPLGSGEAGGPPPLAFSHKILANSASELAPLLGTTPEDVVARLTAAGIPVTDASQPLVDAIQASGKPEMQAIAALARP